MANIKTGDKVKWITPMMAVPHPEGKTDRKGVVLPVFRDTERTGVVMGTHGTRGSVSIRPDSQVGKTPKGMDTYYDLSVNAKNITKI